MTKRAFRVVLVKPSHYDDDGYVIQRWRSFIPSNSLASLYGLVEDCARRQVLGSDVKIEIEAPESIARDIELIKRELPVDILEFFCLTPLPGSEDHKNLFARAVPMDPDMNKYDLEHVCTGHPRMSKESRARVYADAWRRYYTNEHVATILRRAVSDGLKKTKLLYLLVIFSGSVRIEGVHPLQYGILRRKLRTQRRHDMAVLNPLVFYPWRFADFVKTTTQWLWLWWRYHRIMRRVVADPNSLTYRDDAPRPPAEATGNDNLVEVFADKIPHTHGAPTRIAVAG